MCIVVHIACVHVKLLSKVNIITMDANLHCIRSYLLLDFNLICEVCYAVVSLAST